MAKVKHTTNNGEILTTECKKVVTALKRFAEFLGNYDKVYNDMLSKLNNDNNTTTFTDDRYNTITMALTVNNTNDNYTLTINHTHNAPKTIWGICTQDGTIKDFDDRKELFKYAYDNNLYGNFDYIWIEEKELKDEKHDYYETVDYEELDLYKIRTTLELDICDMKIDNTNDNETTDSANTDNIAYTLDNLKNRYAIKDDSTDNRHYVYVETWCKDDKKRVYIKDYKNRSIGYIDAVNGDIKIDNRQGIYADELDYALINIIADMTNHITDNTESYNKTATDSTTCYIKAYYDGKELTVPYNVHSCKQFAVEYIHAMFIKRVVPYETIFTLHYGATAETMTILTAINTLDLIQYNIDDLNDGLKTDNYKKVREGFERICSMINDKMALCINLHIGNNIDTYTIMKSKFEGHYLFIHGYRETIQTPEKFARWLYNNTFTHKIVFKYCHTINEGDTK